jgi:hypothetical protein
MKATGWIALAGLMLVSSPVFAGSPERLGTGGASELRLGVGARGVALGGADAGGVSGVEALFYNPAGIALAGSPTEVLFSYAKYIADMDLNYFAVTQKVGDLGTVGLSVKVLSIGDIERTTETAPDGTGDIFSPTYATLGLTYARQVTDRVSFGLTASYVSERILQESAGGVAFDFGFQYDTDYRGVRLGLTMKNFGPNLEFSGTDFETRQRLTSDEPNAAGRVLTPSSARFELPSLFQFGLSYPAVHGPQGILNLYGLYTSNSFMVDEGRAGGEYVYRKDYALRAGYKITSNSDDLFGLTYGAGVRLPLGDNHLWVDYAGQSVSDFFDDVQHVTLTFQF